MKIEKSRLVDLLVTGLKVTTAANWDDAKLVTKTQNLKKYKEADQTIEDPELARLFEEAVAAQAAGTALEIEGVEPAAPPKKNGGKTPGKGKPAAKPAPAPATPKKGGKPAAQPAAEPKKAGKEKAVPAEAGKRADPPAWADLTKKWAKQPQEYTERGAGVVKYIRDQLLKAGERGKGITKEQLFEKMKLKFPDRTPEKMWTTLKNQVPTRLRVVRGIHVWKDEHGYYIPQDGGKKPQPQAKPSKAEGKILEKPRRGRTPTKNPGKKTAGAAEPALAG